MTEILDETIGEPLLPAGDLDDLFANEDPEPELDLTPPGDETEDQLRARVAKAEKSAKFERDQRVASSRKGWAAEATEHFPYSQPEKITSDSRRGFLEEAKRQDTEFRTQAAPLLEKLDADRETIREEVRAEEEAKAAAMWGRPTTGSGTSGPIDENQTEARLTEARRTRSLIGATKALMDGRRI